MDMNTLVDGFQLTMSIRSEAVGVMEVRKTRLHNVLVAGMQHAQPKCPTGMLPSGGAVQAPDPTVTNWLMGKIPPSVHPRYNLVEETKDAYIARGMEDAAIYNEALRLKDAHTRAMQLAKVYPPGPINEADLAYVYDNYQVVAEPDATIMR